MHTPYTRLDNLSIRWWLQEWVRRSLGSYSSGLHQLHPLSPRHIENVNVWEKI